MLNAASLMRERTHTHTHTHTPCAQQHAVDRLKVHENVMQIALDLILFFLAECVPRLWGHASPESSQR